MYTCGDKQINCLDEGVAQERVQIGKEKARVESSANQLSDLGKVVKSC
jgi:hypothetical protein